LGPYILIFIGDFCDVGLYGKKIKKYVTLRKKKIVLGCFFCLLQKGFTISTSRLYRVFAFYVV
jgi:hypothetical protein